jgi:hypothetical protein
MDPTALRAIVNGAVRGDSALVSADQLMAASRRDHKEWRQVRNMSCSRRLTIEVIIQL